MTRLAAFLLTVMLLVGIASVGAQDAVEPVVRISADGKFFAVVGQDSVDVYMTQGSSKPIFTQLQTQSPVIDVLLAQDGYFEMFSIGTELNGGPVLCRGFVETEANDPYVAKICDLQNGSSVILSDFRTFNYTNTPQAAPTDRVIHAQSIEGGEFGRVSATLVEVSTGERYIRTSLKFEPLPVPTDVANFDISPDGRSIVIASEHKFYYYPDINNWDSFVEEDRGINTILNIETANGWVYVVETDGNGTYESTIYLDEEGSGSATFDFSDAGEGGEIVAMRVVAVSPALANVIVVRELDGDYYATVHELATEK